MITEAFSTVSYGILEEKLAARATIEYWYEFTVSEGRKTNSSLKDERNIREPVLIYIMDTITELFYYEFNCRHG